MDFLVGFYDQIVLAMAFIFGRFSKGGFRKVYFFVKFSNEIYRFYSILKIGTKSCNIFVRYSNIFLLYFIIFPTGLTLLFFIAKGVLFITDPFEDSVENKIKEVPFDDFILPN